MRRRDVDATFSQRNKDGKEAKQKRERSTDLKFFRMTVTAVSSFSIFSCSLGFLSKVSRLAMSSSIRRFISFQNGVCGWLVLVNLVRGWRAIR